MAAKSNLISKKLLSAFRNLRPTPLNNYLMLAASNRSEFSMRLGYAKLKEIEPSIMIVEKNPSSEDSLFLSRFIKLHGKRCLDTHVGVKRKNLKLMAQQLVPGTDEKIKEAYVDTLFELYPVNHKRANQELESDLKFLSDGKLSFSQQAELACHIKSMDFVNESVSIFEKRTSDGIVIRNESNLPGEETISFVGSQLNNSDIHFSRRCLRKIVTSCVAEKISSESFDAACRFLKTISPLDELVAKAEGFAALGDIESIQNLRKIEGVSVFSESKPEIKFTFNLCTALELFLSGFKKESFKYLFNCHNTEHRRRDGEGTNEEKEWRRNIGGVGRQIVADSVITYCIVNKHDEFVNYMLKHYRINPWNGSFHPLAINARKNVDNSHAKSLMESKNWYLFCSSYRQPTIVKSAPIKPRKPERVGNKQLNIKHMTTFR